MLDDKPSINPRIAVAIKAIVQRSTQTTAWISIKASDHIQLDL